MNADPREEQRVWVKGVMRDTGLSATALADAAKLAQTTITDLVNNRSKHALSARTVAKIERFAKRRFVPAAPGFGETESAPYDSGMGGNLIDSLVAEATRHANNLAPHWLRSRALEALGYLPGDILIVEMGRTPAVRDVVCAEVLEWEGVTPEVLFRVYEPPSLVAATGVTELLSALAIDNRRVKVIGVVVAMIRPPRAKAA